MAKDDSCFAAKMVGPVEIPDFYTKDMVPGYDADDADNKMYMFCRYITKGISLDT